MAKPLLSRDERRAGEVETIEQRERDSKRICFRDRVECIVRAVEPTASPLGVGNHSRYTYMLHLPPLSLPLRNTSHGLSINGDHVLPSREFSMRSLNA
jgi:hypothetical protein